MFICAQLDSTTARVNAVCILKAPIEGDHIVLLPEWREDILGWHYDRETGEFYPPEPDGEE